VYAWFSLASSWASLCGLQGCVLRTLPSQWFLAPAGLYAYQSLLQIAKFGWFVERGRCDRRCLIWPNSYCWLVNHCAMPSIGKTWVLASIGAVVEMGVLTRTLKRLLESMCSGAIFYIMRTFLEFHIFTNSHHYRRVKNNLHGWTPLWPVPRQEVSTNCDKMTHLHAINKPFLVICQRKDDTADKTYSAYDVVVLKM
jgi:hypothetical protein